MKEAGRYVRADRPDAIKKIYRHVILMPKWGSKNVIVREAAILLPRVSILEGNGGFGEDNGLPPIFQTEGKGDEPVKL